jgi:hypothetical protein
MRGVLVINEEFFIQEPTDEICQVILCFLSLLDMTALKNYKEWAKDRYLKVNFMG